MAGKANQMEGGVKRESSPHVGMESQRSTTSTQNAPTYQEVPTLTMEGWCYALQSNQAKVTANQKKHSMRSCSLKEWGDVYTDPLKQTIHLTINRDSRQTHFKLIMTVVHMRKLLYHKS